MTNLREKNRAVWNAGFPSHDFAWAVREWIAAATERMEPASEPAKVGYVCPKCGASEEGHYDCRARSYTCKPAQPEPVAEVGNEDCVKAKQEGLWLAKVLEPVAAEMPEAVRDCISSLVQAAADSDEPDDQFEYQRVAENLESFWRTHAAQVAFDLRTMTAKYDNERVLRERDASTHAAQPAKVRMTEELERVLASAFRESQSLHCPAGTSQNIQSDIAAVRAQAAEAGKVRMPTEIRTLLEMLRRDYPRGEMKNSPEYQAAIWAALDAAEGRK